MTNTPKAARAERAARPAPSPRTGDSDPNMDEALRRVRTASWSSGEDRLRRPTPDRTITVRVTEAGVTGAIRKGARR